MPSRRALPGTISRDKFLRALKRLGFIISKRGGKGSHIKIEWPKNGKCIIVQSNLRKDVLDYVLDDIEEISKITWQEIKREL